MLRKQKGKDLGYGLCCEQRKEVEPVILEAEIHLIHYKYSVHTSKETNYVTATKTSRLMLFREVIADHFENHENT
jgi:uncharacterized protein YchJ